jgi:phosphoribosylformylglycinamidine cyclo-ligase
VVDDGELLGPHRVREGDALVGLSSTGLHANGFSLIRATLLRDGPEVLRAVPEGFDRTLADELLEPTAIYAPLLRSLSRRELIRSAAHVTGGGIVGNVPRALPEGLGAEIPRGSWPVPPIFDLVQRASGASDADMDATFNMGVGMVLVVPPDGIEEVVATAEAASVRAQQIGRVVPGSGAQLLA